MLQHNEFTGKTVFVAGGTSGINLGIAKAFAAAGAKVAVFSRSQERVDAAVATLRELTSDAMGFSGDVRDMASVQDALSKTHEAWGTIDVLCSGAAGNFVAPAAVMSPNGFKSVMDIDLLGSFHVLRAAYAYLTKPGASIINISAPQASKATPMQAHVCAAKAGVDMLTKVLAMEWGPEGVRVNSIVPGPIAGTEGMERLTPTPESKAAVTQNMPLRRYGEISDVANVAVMLSSSVFNYVTGVVLPVDGGASLAGPGLLGGQP